MSFIDVCCITTLTLTGLVSECRRQARPPLRPSAPPASQRAGAASPNCRLPAGRSVASTGVAAGGAICGAADSQRILARHVCAQRTAALQSAYIREARMRTEDRGPPVSAGRVDSSVVGCCWATSLTRVTCFQGNVGGAVCERAVPPAHCLIVTGYWSRELCTCLFSWLLVRVFHGPGGGRNS